MLKEYAQIKQNMDLQEQLHMQMKREQELKNQQPLPGQMSNMHGSGRQSDPSGGISAFRGGASMDGYDAGVDASGVPQDKFVVGDSASDMITS